MLASLIGWSIAVLGWNIYWVLRDINEGGLNELYERFFNSGWLSILFWIFLLSGFIFLFFI